MAKTAKTPAKKQTKSSKPAKGKPQKAAGVKAAKPKAAVKPAKQKEEAVRGPLSKVEAQAMAGQYFEQMLASSLWHDVFFHQDAGKQMLKADPAVHVGIIRLLADRIAKLRQELPAPIRGNMRSPFDPAENRVVFMYFCLRDVNNYPHKPAVLAKKVLARPLPFTSEDFAYILGRLAEFELVCLEAHQFLPKLLDQLQQHVAEHGVTPALAKQITRLADAMDAPQPTRSGTTGAAAQRRAIATLRDMAAMA